MTYKILLVDDEPEIITVLEFFLKKLGYTSVKASSGEEAFSTLCSDKIDFVISDFRMANGSGLDLIKKCMLNQIKTPILLMTGHADLTLADVKNCGGIGILPKPFDIDKVKLYLDQYLKVKDEASYL